MLNPVKSSPPAPRKLRGKALSEGAVDATDLAKPVDGRLRPDHVTPYSRRARDGEESEKVSTEGENRSSAIDEAMKALLQDASSLREPSAEPLMPDHSDRIKDLPMTPEFRERRAVDRHITAATLYARLERSDNRDAVLRPGAVFSKKY